MIYVFGITESQLPPPKQNLTVKWLVHDFVQANLCITLYQYNSMHIVSSYVTTYTMMNYTDNMDMLRVTSCSSTFYYCQKMDNQSDEHSTDQLQLPWK